MDSSLHYTFLILMIIISLTVLFVPFWGVMELSKGNYYEDTISWGLFYVNSDLENASNDFSLLDQYKGFSNFKYYRNVLQVMMVLAVTLLVLSLVCSLAGNKNDNMMCFVLLLMSGILFFFSSIVAMSTDFAKNQQITRERLRSYDLEIFTGGSTYTTFTIGMFVLLYCILLLSVNGDGNGKSRKSRKSKKSKKSKFRFHEQSAKQYFEF
tara:strand:- start:208 stop:837 length:630 start_codon:yes stop_codon:yes gene_type:complete